MSWEMQLDDKLLEELYKWIDNLSLTRPKKRIERDFSLSEQHAPEYGWHLSGSGDICHRYHLHHDLSDDDSASGKDADYRAYHG